MAYFDGIFCPIVEESLNKFLSPDPDPNPDHLSGGPSHGYNTSCVKKIKSIVAIVFEFALGQTDRQTNRPKCITFALLSGSEGKYVKVDLLG